MEQEKANKLLERWEELKDARRRWEDTWKEITKYLNPRRGLWDDTGQADEAGEMVGRDIYDTTPQESLNMLTNGLHGYSASPAIRWFKLAMETPELERIPYTLDWLEEVEKILYSSFNNSNFYDAYYDIIQDTASLGTGSILQTEDSGRMIYTSIHPKQLYIAEDYDHRIDLVARHYVVSARQLYQRFGKYLDKQSGEEIQRDLDKNPGTKYQVLHMVFPRRDRAYQGLSRVNMPYASVYINVTTGKFIYEGGFKSMPYLVWRWRKNTDEVYGRGPGMDNIYEIKKINQIAKTQLKAAQLAVEPPLNVPQEMKGNVRWVPRGLNYYNEVNKVIVPANPGLSYPIGIDQEERLANKIREAFHVDFFLMLARAERQMTATEVVERQGEKAAVLGAVVGRLQNEVLSPIIERTYSMLMDNGKIPPPPPELIEQSGERIKIEFLGPLAQAQRKYQQSQGIQVGLGLIGAMAQLNPNVLDLVDFDELGRDALSSAGVSQKAIRETEDVAKLRKAKAEMMEQQQQLNQMEQLGKALPGLAKAGMAGTEQQLQGAVRR